MTDANFVVGLSKWRAQSRGSFTGPKAKLWYMTSAPKNRDTFTLRHT